MSTSLNNHALSHGTRLLQDKYAIGPVIERDELSITYKGGDMLAKRYVAIKEFFPANAVRDGLKVAYSGEWLIHKEALLQEASSLVRLTHDSIIRVYEVFEENNSFYVVMEMLEGESLAQLVHKSGPLDEKLVLRIGDKLTSALNEVHATGLHHLNIKPENVKFVGPRVVLLGFGAARFTHAKPHAKADLAARGYTPIEQYAAHAKFTAATDIYALAATLYYALTGQIPTHSTDRAAGIPLVAPTEICPSVTPFVEAALLKALKLDQEKRPLSASDFGVLLKGHVPFYNPAFSNVVKYQPETEEQFEGQESVVSATDAHNQTNMLKDHTSYVNDLSFSPSTSYLVSVGQDRSIVVWNWARSTLYRRLKKHEGAINSVAYSPDGSLFATGGKDQKLLVWPTGEALQNEPQFTPYETGSEILQLAFHPTQRALTWTDETSLKTWDLSGQIPVIDSRFNLTLFSFSPDGFSIVGTQRETGFIYRFNGQSLQLEEQLAAHGVAITGLSYSPDGSSIASCGVDGYIRCWNAQTGELKWEVNESHPELKSLTWSPDSKLLAVGKREWVSLWKVEGEHWRQFRRHEKFVQSVAFAPSAPAPFNYVLATASRDRTIAVHRIR